MWFPTQPLATLTRANQSTISPKPPGHLGNPMRFILSWLEDDRNREYMKKWDDDQQLIIRYDDDLVDSVIEDFDPDRFYGTGTTNTVFRFREGIERFLITDINNPARSARAQSQIHLMWDNLSVGAEGFNHIPGGANVLYVDGHVEYMKYGTKPPINSGYATLLGGFQRHMASR